LIAQFKLFKLSVLIFSRSTIAGGGDFSIGTKPTLDGSDGGITVAGKY